MLARARKNYLAKLAATTREDYLRAEPVDVRGVSRPGGSYSVRVVRRSLYEGPLLLEEKGRIARLLERLRAEEPSEHFTVSEMVAVMSPGGFRLLVESPDLEPGILDCYVRL